MLTAIKFSHSPDRSFTSQEPFTDTFLHRPEQPASQQSCMAWKKFPCRKVPLSELAVIFKNLLFQVEEEARHSCGKYFEFFKPHLLQELVEFKNQLSQDEAALFATIACEHGYVMSDTRLLHIATEERLAFNTILARRK